MRWITRVFVSAAVRRIAVICVLALLGWLGIGTARAATYPDQGSAYAGCISAATSAVSYLQSTRPLAGFSGGSCVLDSPRYIAVLQQNGVTYWISQIAGHPYDAFHFFPEGTSCSSRPDVTGSGPWSSFATSRNGTTNCDNGCWRSWYDNGDGTMTGKTTLGEVCPYASKDTCQALGSGFYFNSALAACELPEAESCPSGQQKNASGDCVENKCPNGMVEGPAGTCINEKNECPAGEVKSPTGQCLPGEGQCAQGEARGKDGTCKRDSDGDGIPDNEDDDPSNDDEKESFSGGDNCNSPPACNGSPIACGQARIQWRIECNTRRNVTITGGACTSMPICAGKECNAMEYSQLLQQWKAACALEKLASQTPGGGSGGNSDLIAYLNNGGPLNADAFGAGEVGGGTGWGEGDGEGEEFEPDTGGFGYSRSCPVFPSINVMGTSINFDVGPMCDWFALAGSIVLIIAGLACVRIVAGGTA